MWTYILCSFWSGCWIWLLLYVLIFVFIINSYTCHYCFYSLISEITYFWKQTNNHTKLPSYLSWGNILYVTFFSSCLRCKNCLTYWHSRVVFYCCDCNITVILMKSFSYLEFIIEVKWPQHIKLCVCFQWFIYIQFFNCVKGTGHHRICKHQNLVDFRKALKV